MNVIKISVFTLLMLFLSIVMGCSQTSYRVTETRDFCKTGYPVVLVHGIGVRDEMWISSFWGDIPSILRQEGAVVYTGQQKAWDTIENNAMILKKTIDAILAHTGAEKVNIIAHSKGGLESRYMISRLEMADKVASLTTICTPHRGSAIANIASRYVSGPYQTAVSEANLWGKLIGDDDPDCYRAVANLTTAYLEKFNAKILDMKQVYYQSYGAAIDNNYPNPYWRLSFQVLFESEGDNDGLVSVASCKWGEFQGIVQSQKKQGVSHLDIVGRTAFSGVDDFDAPAFFVKIVNDLKRKGL